MKLQIEARSAILLSLTWLWTESFAAGMWTLFASTMSLQAPTGWIARRLDPAKFGTHSLRRTKAVLIYRRTGNLSAVQLLLGHSKIESTVRYLGIVVDAPIDRLIACFRGQPSR